MNKNPDDTEQVYHIRGALRTPAFYKHAVKFLESPIGQKIYDEERDLANMLDDPDRLSQMPVGTVGHSYWFHMVSEGLCAKALIKAYQDSSQASQSYNDRVEWYLERQRDIHDLLHVLTNYGCDNIGEQCMLGFSDSQCPSLGALFIAYVGGAVVRPKLPHNVKLLKSINEGRDIGRKAKIIAHQMIGELLPMPVVEVRAMLNIAEPKIYQNNLLLIEKSGIDPYDILQRKN